MKQEVNVYVLPTSPDTGRIERFLASKGIDFNLYDIRSDVKAHKRMLEATRGACGAPVIENRASDRVWIRYRAVGRNYE